MWEGEGVNHIPDPVELGEMAAERAADELCLPDGRMHCYRCAAIFDPQVEGGFDLPDPYAPPCCPKCLEEAMTQL